jgi:hypothetical protein
MQNPKTANRRTQNSMSEQVSSYSVRYNLNSNQGTVTVQLENGRDVRLNVNSDAELVVALLLLGKNPVDYDPATGAMACGPRPVGT